MPLTKLIPEILRLMDPRQRLRILAVVLLSAFNAVLEAIGALLILALLTTLIGQGKGSLPSVMNPLLRVAKGDRLIVIVALVTLAFYAVRLCTGVLEQYLQQREVQRAAADTSTAVLSSQLRVALETYYAQGTGEHLRDTWVASEIVFRTSLLGAMALVSESLVILALLATVVVLSPGVTIATFAALAIVVGSIYRGLRHRMLRWGEAVEELGAECFKRLQESYGALREVRLAGAEDYFIDRYQRPREDLARVLWRQGTVSAAPRFVLEALFVASIVTIVLVMVAAGTQDQGTLSLLGVYGYAGVRMLPSANRFVTALTNIRYGDAALRTVRGALDAPSVQPADRADDRLASGWSELRFDNVTFTFSGSDQPAVVDLHLTVRRGERLGIVGRSGAGKTTFLDLLTGLLDPSHGRITIDGTDMADVLGSWQRRVAYVSQNVFLIDDDVRTNVAFGVARQTIDDAKVWQALELAQVADTIKRLPGQLDSMLGERGLRLSGGQRQRIAVARALYRDPDVLVLDEATAALDNATERSLNQAVEALAVDRSVIIVAHRISSVQNCDRLVVLENGHLVAEGTYADLLLTSATFQEIAANTVQEAPIDLDGDSDVANSS